MRYSTTDTYEMKRKIVRFNEKICEELGAVETRFASDMVYGILTSGSCRLSRIADAIQEPIRKINVIDRLSRHLTKPIPETLKLNYARQMRRIVADGGCELEIEFLE